jgi:translation initiation factor IF-3
MRERAEERARHQAEQQRWMVMQEQQAMFLQQMQQLQQQQQQMQQMQFRPHMQAPAPQPRLAQAPPRFHPAPPLPLPPAAVGAGWQAGAARPHQPMETWLEETYSQMAVQQMSIGIEAPAPMPTVLEQAADEEPSPRQLQPPAPVRAPPPPVHRPAAPPPPAAAAATALERQQPTTLDELALALAAVQP